jgi:uncharacterized repeat protein (TIGR01451 family)
MKRKKANIENLSTLLGALIPRMDVATKRQMHSLFTLVISSMFVMIPFLPVVEAQAPQVYINKTVTSVMGGDGHGNVTAAGNVISYQINVNNTGNMSLTNVTVTDPLAYLNNNTTVNSLDSGDQATLKNNNHTVILEDLGVGENATIYGNYTVTQEDINSNGTVGDGFIINNATVVSEGYPTPENSNNANVSIIQNANCTIEKTVIGVNGQSGGNVTEAGDLISYQINVNNTGNVNLTNVNVTDPLAYLNNNTVTGLDSGDQATPQNNNHTVILEDLGVGENATIYGNYTVTQEDINSNGTVGDGFIVNNATVVSEGYPTPENSNNANVSIIQNANCTIEKTVIGVNGQSGGNVTEAGDLISYQINVNNTGNVNLTNVNVTDPLAYLNNNTVTGLDSGEQATPQNNNHTVILEDLGVGENATIYGNYTVTQEDINSNGTVGDGFIINNATVVSEGYPTPENSNNANVSIIQNANCTIDKTAIGVTDPEGNAIGGNVTEVGDVIAYQVVVTNNGNIDLTNVTVNDTLIDDLTGPVQSNNNATNSNDTILQVGENWTYTGNYTVTQADINSNGTAGSGFINNTATVYSNQVGPKSASASVDPKSTSANTPIERNPEYSIFNSVISPDPNGDCIINSPGDEVPYRIVVKNEGNVDLTNVRVNDPMVSLPDPTGDENNDGVLNPGETWIYDAPYTLTQEDIDNGHIDNTATVSSNELPDKSSSVDTPVDKNADLSIYKSVTGIDEAGDHMIDSPGDIINYQIAVKNNGDVTLHNVHVTDSLIGDLSGPTGDSVDPGVLNPGETWVYKDDYTVTQTDIDNNGDGSGFITNTATVSCNEHPSESNSIQLPIITSVNTRTDTNNVPDNTSGNGSESQPATTNVQPATSSSSGGSGDGSSGGSSGGSIGSASIAGSSSSTTTNTSAATNVTPTETSTPIPEQTVTPANVQTPEPKNTSTPVKQRTPGFEVIGGIICLLGAVYLYRRR